MDYNTHSHLLYNNVRENVKVSYELSLLLKECETFDFSIAFIAMSGLASLKETFNTLRLKNIRGRIVTSTYLSFNEPKMFEELLKYPNIEVRIYDDKYGFHSKGYLFYNHKGCNAIVGSSNLTQSALSINQEWNVFFSSKYNQQVIEQIQSEFNYQWEHALPLTKLWIEDYKKTYIKPIRVKPANQVVIKPNLMQERALASLESLRKKGQDKALLISATGTGKTYLSAFDVLKVNPKKMLFVVHRRSIAIKAMETFESIIPYHTMGLFSGTEKIINVDYIFATVQTMSKVENLQLFDREHFDYIIIDEVHKSGAQTYQTLVNYFKPLFLFGMSATPERSDGFDIYEMFNHNIAYEIRLQQAMEYDLLCPFHYYGISDLKVDGMEIGDKTLFNSLVSDQRVDYIIEKINDYGYSGDKVHGLIFVSRKKEAIELSQMFNDRGFRTIALTGEDSEYVRQEAMNRLEASDQDALDYIITVDIFNDVWILSLIQLTIMCSMYKARNKAIF